VPTNGGTKNVRAEFASAVHQLGSLPLTFKATLVEQITCLVCGLTVTSTDATTDASREGFFPKAPDGFPFLSLKRHRAGNAKLKGRLVERDLDKSPSVFMVIFHLPILLRMNDVYQVFSPTGIDWITTVKPQQTRFMITAGSGLPQ
jgi:hypothetical protein